MQIGNIKMDNNVFLAPMAGITDLPFRLLCKEQGCGMVYTEMISAKGAYFGNKRTHNMLEVHEDERPIGVQIFGSDPSIMADMVAEISKANIDVIDINMGCPAPKIVKNGEGSKLMKDPDRVRAIVKNVVASSIKPVTVKMRAGWDTDSINAIEIARIAEEEGAQAVTVHGRTREQYYSGYADWSIIAQVKRAVDIPVIGNGDINKPEDAEKMLQQTGCDGIMIGRGAQGNPWIFNRIIHYLDSGELLPEPTPEEKIHLAIRHFNMSIDQKGHKIAIPEMRKHISWYLKGLQGAAKMRALINKVNDADEIIDILYAYLKDV
ncbi:MAG: tRNA dihydrouridine synthase DusB [Clostridiales bacterium]|nr:tRNA dihydrouridine synthase DusB [Clostridiales bacterium]